ncbi:uncharacterized protein VTP21DRAFT_3601 [Calcarisporiella thermophila]|uniref:uncharacterized protein n=1 Tax=Calcarisporiella thermophila TaxID=911321 RepID=UPI0037426483
MPTRQLYQQDYHSIFRAYTKKGAHFIDERFPPGALSLGTRLPELGEGNIEWKRIKDICPNPILVQLKEDGTIGNDVIQGAVGNCWLIAGMTVLRIHPPLVDKVVPYWRQQGWEYNLEFPQTIIGEERYRTLDEHPGVFRFRFYHFGEWVEVVVDDYLPTCDGQLVYARSSNPREFWPSLLEKAYAKLCGSYESLETGSASMAFIEFTGRVSETIEMFGPHIKMRATNGELFKHLKKAHRASALMSSCISPEHLQKTGNRASLHDLIDETLPNGLIIGHSYSITDLRHIGTPWYAPWKKRDICLVRLHNPWGMREWNGAWADNSEEWKLLSKAKRRKWGAKSGDNGDFWMVGDIGSHFVECIPTLTGRYLFFYQSFDDFCAQFTHLIIARELNTSPFGLGKIRWRAFAFRGLWSKVANTTGGCINHLGTFHLNHQYIFTLREESYILISLMQRDRRRELHPILNTRNNLTIGFVVLRVEMNRKQRITNPRYDVVGKVTFTDACEVSARFLLPAGRFVIVPSTFQPNEEGEFYLRIYFSSEKSKVKELEQVAMPSPWWYPRWLYGGKDYYRGSFRVSIVSARLKLPRGIKERPIKESPKSTNGTSTLQSDSLQLNERSQRAGGKMVADGFDTYCRLIFVHARTGNIVEEFITPKCRNTAQPFYDVDYLFYARHPEKIGVVIQCFRQRLLLPDELLGEIRVHGRRYCQPEKAGRIWEFTRPLCRIKRARRSEKQLDEKISTPSLPEAERRSRTNHVVESPLPAPPVAPSNLRGDINRPGARTSILAVLQADGSIGIAGLPEAEGNRRENSDSPHHSLYSNGSSPGTANTASATTIVESPDTPSISTSPHSSFGPTSNPAPPFNQPNSKFRHVVAGTGDIKLRIMFSRI